MDLQAESRGHGRKELPELHIQVMCVQLLAWIADSLKKTDMLPAYCYHSDNWGCREGSTGITNVIFMSAIEKFTLGY